MGQYDPFAQHPPAGPGGQATTPAQPSATPAGRRRGSRLPIIRAKGPVGGLYGASAQGGYGRVGPSNTLEVMAVVIVVVLLLIVLGFVIFVLFVAPPSTPGATTSNAPSNSAQRKHTPTTATKPTSSPSPMSSPSSASSPATTTTSKGGTTSSTPDNSATPFVILMIVLAALFIGFAAIAFIYLYPQRPPRRPPDDPFQWPRPIMARAPSPNMYASSGIGGAPPYQPQLQSPFDATQYAMTASAGDDPMPWTPQPPPAPLVRAQPLTPMAFDEKEPTDLSDPVPHTAVIKPEPDSKGWITVGSSLRGLSHKHDGKYREDSLGSRAVKDWHLIAVADGGGSYKLARVGAWVAVEAALAEMAQVAQNAKPEAQALGNMLLRGLWAAYQALHAEADRRNTQAQAQGEQISVRDLRTTLLLLAHREGKGNQHLVGGVQVGDGIIVGRDQNRQFHLLGQPDIGPTGNEVTFLTDSDPKGWSERVRINDQMKGPTCYFLVMTDGVSDDFGPVEENLERLEQPLFQSILQDQQKDPAKLAAIPDALTKLISYERVGSFDDRTLVCLYKWGELPWK